MQKTIPLVALCALFTGCSCLSTVGSEKKGSPFPDSLRSRGVICASAEGDDEWWYASCEATPGAWTAIGPDLFRRGVGYGGIEAVSDVPGQSADVFPLDLNEGKSFWAPDRRFGYLFEHYQYPERSWWRDFAGVPSALWDDIRHLAQPGYLLALGMGAALAGGVRSMDHDIADHFEDTDVLGGGEDFGDALGHPGLHLGIAGTIYLYGRLAGDNAALERSRILAEGLIINDLATLLLKTAFNRERPNGDNWSFPSGHVSSTFALAAMLDEMYGHRIGYPMYLLGGFVAFARMNDEEHYLSDTVFAAFLGYTVGKAVFDRHKVEMFGFELQPYLEGQTGAIGLSFTRGL